MKNLNYFVFLLLLSSSVEAAELKMNLSKTKINSGDQISVSYYLLNNRGRRVVSPNEIIELRSFPSNTCSGEGSVIGAQFNLTQQTKSTNYLFSEPGSGLYLKSRSVLNEQIQSSCVGPIEVTEASVLFQKLEISKLEGQNVKVKIDWKNIDGTKKATSNLERASISLFNNSSCSGNRISSSRVISLKPVNSTATATLNLSSFTNSVWAKAKSGQVESSCLKVKSLFSQPVVKTVPNDNHYPGQGYSQYYNNRVMGNNLYFTCFTQGNPSEEYSGYGLCSFNFQTNEVSRVLQLNASVNGTAVSESGFYMYDYYRNNLITINGNSASFNQLNYLGSSLIHQYGPFQIGNLLVVDGYSAQTGGGYFVVDQNLNLTKIPGYPYADAYLSDFFSFGSNNVLYSYSNYSNSIYRYNFLTNSRQDIIQNLSEMPALKSNSSYGYVFSKTPQENNEQKTSLLRINLSTNQEEEIELGSSVNSNLISVPSKQSVSDELVAFVPNINGVESSVRYIKNNSSVINEKFIPEVANFNIEDWDPINQISFPSSMEGTLIGITNLNSLGKYIFIKAKYNIFQFGMPIDKYKLYSLNSLTQELTEVNTVVNLTLSNPLEPTPYSLEPQKITVVSNRIVFYLPEVEKLFSFIPEANLLEEIPPLSISITNWDIPFYVNGSRLFAVGYDQLYQSKIQYVEF